MSSTRDGETPQPHFALFPFMAQGHLIPMADIGRLLAKHGVRVTIITTPINGDRIRPAISRSGLSIEIAQFDFPSAEAGLPQGIESIDMVHAFEDTMKFLKAAPFFQERLRRLLLGLRPFPSCLIADMCFTWAGNLAGELGIPRIAFHGMSCFSLLCWHMLRIHDNFDEIASDTEYFVLPNLPHKIEMTKAQLRGSVDPLPQERLKFREDVLRADREAFGTIFNSFQELQPQYLTEYKKLTGKKAWCVGPVSLCNNEDPDKAERGNRPSIDGQDCSKWLDSKEPRSVLYVCLGSIAALATSQLIEIGLALENSGHPFIWVVRDDDSSNEDFNNWVSENGFEERVEGRGLVIRGWAPQVLILSHPSVGGFFTHCGWNSTLEGISYGLPLLTWPVLGEQFCNERFIVDVIRTGVRIGVELPITFGDAERVGVQAESGDIEKAIYSLLMNNKGSEERKERAAKLGRTAKRAVEEGGSSYDDLNSFVEDVMKEAHE